MRCALSTSAVLFALAALACADGDSPVDPNGGGPNGQDCPPTDPRARSFYLDADGDGWGLSTVSEFGCAQPDGYVERSGDCDDSNASVFPGAPDDQCNGVDNNCDRVPDSDAAEVLRFRDNDGDTWGNDAQTGLGCLPSAGWTEVGGDCDDNDPTVNPGAEELCDGKDTDCNDIPNDGLWGSGALCAAESCRDILELLPGSASGTYWLEDDAGAYQAQCRMDSTGGWTRLTSELLRDRGWVEFRASEQTAASDWVGRWDGNTLEMIPRRKSHLNDCTTVSVRAFIDLPFTFDMTEGELVASAITNDTDSPLPGDYFEGGSPPCRGAVKASVAVGPSLKRGGEWGLRFNSSAVVSWTRLTIARGSYGFTLEINDFNDGSTHRANLRVDNIDIWVH